ncbi:hypothetical protein LCGC14_0789780 [marine sediment metagenome]|uniref:Uncharacterized protein n=1 Tax=marine sediment metagenome TaxID=412755 RepID=A0A0F9QCT3_9ZZZZ
MSTSLNTLNTPDGIELSDDSGVVQYLVTYTSPNLWRVMNPNNEPLASNLDWPCHEAAEFYALALYSAYVQDGGRPGWNDTTTPEEETHPHPITRQGTDRRGSNAPYRHSNRRIVDRRTNSLARWAGSSWQ